MSFLSQEQENAVKCLISESQPHLQVHFFIDLGVERN